MAQGNAKTALLVIDMQNDFIEPGGPMHVAGGQAIAPSVIKAVQVARQHGITIIWAVREHDPLGRDVELFRRHFYIGGKEGPTAKGTKGAELVEGLLIEEGDYKIVKTRFSAFFATHLHSFLQSNGFKSVVVVGVQTPNCVRQTVFDAVALDYQPVMVIVDATAAATPDIHTDGSCQLVFSPILAPIAPPAFSGGGPFSIAMVVRGVVVKFRLQHKKLLLMACGNDKILPSLAMTVVIAMA
ncbi:hypothetical protein ACLOJK_040236 [Asimina triloba]